MNVYVYSVCRKTVEMGIERYVYFIPDLKMVVNSWNFIFCIIRVLLLGSVIDFTAL